MADPGVLSAQRATFVAIYCNNGFNALEAGRLAKYRSDVTPWKLLKDPEVRAAISRVVNLRARKLDISGEAVLREAARIAFYDIRDVIQWSPEGYTLTPSDAIPDVAAAAIEKVQVRQQLDGTVVTTVTMAHKAPYLRILARHTGVEPLRGADIDTVNLISMQGQGDNVVDMRQQQANLLVSGLNEESLMALAEKAMREFANDAADNPADA